MLVPEEGGGQVLTSLAMFSMIREALRLMAVVLSWRRPRTSRGTMMDRVGASTACQQQQQQDMT